MGAATKLKNIKKIVLKYHLLFFCAIKMIHFLERIVTCDEKWILCNNWRRSTHWLDQDETSQHFPKSKFHQKKIIMIVWWSVTSLIHHNFLNSGETITAKMYCQFDEMHEKLRLCPILLNRNVLSFSTIMLRHTSLNWSYKNWMNWPTKLYFIHTC